MVADLETVANVQLSLLDLDQTGYCVHCLVVPAEPDYLYCVGCANDICVALATQE